MKKRVKKTTIQERRLGLKTSRKESSVILQCRKCKYVWRPDPHKWRNLYSIRHEEIPKVLKCACCGIPNRIDNGLLQEILR